MYNQYLFIKGRLTQSPIFTETHSGKKFAEITILQKHKFTDKNGAEIEITTPFTLILDEELENRIKRFKDDDLIEATGAYLQNITENKIEHLVIVDSIDKIKDAKKNNLIITVKGNLTATPELKESSKGTEYFKTAIATNSKINNSDVEIALFYNLFFNGDALIGNKDLKKGEYVEVEGNLELKPYQSRDGSSKLDCTIYVKNTKKIEYSVDDNLRPFDPRYNNKSD